MTLSTFLRAHREQILEAFEAFARTLMPAGVNMVPVELRDHADEMLTAIAHDIEDPQTRDEQAEKSQGLDTNGAMGVSGQQHADARIRHGFTPAQLMAEFRAMRASVLRLYEDSGATDSAGVRRFNEAIDEALTESMTRYGVMTNLYRDQFVGVLGHDLRTPLNAIRTGAALLTASRDLGPRQTAVASAILRSADRMDRMIHDLLDLTLARLGGAIPIKRTPVDLADVCRDVCLEVQAARPDAILRFNAAGDLSGAWDGDRLAQVVTNLLSNAVQHGEGGTVTLEADGAGDAVTVSVHNGGAPVPPELRHAIFEPLVRRQPGSDNGSIGLGLFIARAIVTSHGGELDVTSTAEEGTRFTVRLPRTVTPAAHSSGACRNRGQDVG